MAKAIIKNLQVNWVEIKNLCRETVSMSESSKEPTKEWKRKLLICRHSPIRTSVIKWRWEEIPYAISTHFARHHIGCEKWISTSREDRTGIDRTKRSQMDNVSMTMEANIEALQNIAEKRLCMCADKTTREYMEDLKEQISYVEEDVSWSLVPSCVRCGGCIETFSNCHYYESMMKDSTLEEQMNITKRYDIYNEKVKKLRR